MDFEELHGKGGSNANVGVDLTTLMTSQIAISTAGESGGGGSGGGDMTVPRIASFQAYWDVQDKKFKVFSPKVIDPSGNEIAVTETVLSRGTYVCEVKKNATTGNYTAAIKLVDSVVPSPETVTVVKLFKIEDGKVEQYHVGAIILSGGGNAVSTKAAFDLEVTESSTGTKTGKIVRCNFVFDGENKPLSDFSVSGSGSVYLVAKQPAPSGGMGDLPWTFEISESEGEAAEGGRVINYKLYDLSDFSVTCDYRTTFLELKSPHHVARFIVSKYDNPSSSVKLDACQDNEASVKAETDSASATLSADSSTAKLELAGSENTVTLDPSDLSQDGGAQFHKLTVKHSDGKKTEYDVLADKDIVIVDADVKERLTDVEIELHNTTLRIKKTFTDKYGSTRYEYSTGITVKQTDVVTGSNYSSANKTFKNARIKAIVLNTEPVSAEEVFNAVPHSENS